MKDIKILHQFDENNTIHIIAESTSEGSCCPRCGTISKSKHSKYTRKLSDGSLEGFSKKITIIIRKFKCRFSSCSQKIFTERLPFASAYARITNKAIELITFLALTISAEKLSCIIKKLGISISHDTILRLIRKLPQQTAKIDDSVKNISIDDFAFKKRKKYCTLICDMDKRIILDILPSRNKEAVVDWLKKYPQIRLVSRDGSISYSGAITESLPNALQVSDKFHLVKNLLDNINRYVKRK